MEMRKKVQNAGGEEMARGISQRRAQIQDGGLRLSSMQIGECYPQRIMLASARFDQSESIRLNGEEQEQSVYDKYSGKLEDSLMPCEVVSKLPKQIPISIESLNIIQQQLKKQLETHLIKSELQPGKRSKNQIIASSSRKSLPPQNVKNEKCGSLEQNVIKGSKEMIDDFVCQSRQMELYLENKKREISHIFNEKAIKNMNKALSKHNLMTLKTFESSYFHTFFRNLIRNWHIHHISYYQVIYKFVRINQYKQLVYKKAYEFLYPYMPKLLVDLRAKLKIDSIEEEIMWLSLRRQRPFNLSENEHRMNCRQDYLSQMRKLFGIEDHITDKIVQHFVQEQDNIHKNDGAIYIKVQGAERVLLKEFISEYEDFKIYNAFWEYFFNTYRFRNQMENIETSGKNEKMRVEMMKDFAKNGHFQRMVECGCLGCSPFFYYGGNVVDQIINRTPIVSMPQISKMKDYEPRIKDEICSLLNSGGGVILFGTRQEYKNIITYGESMTQKDKEEYQQRIYSYLADFYPRPETKNNVFVSFVPVVTDPYFKHHLKQLLSYNGVEGIAKKQQFYYQREYVEGLYVTRIRVCPTEGTHVYYWSNEQHFYSSIRKNGKRVELKISQLPQIMKQKFNRFYIPQRYGPQEISMLRRPANCFDHECVKADIGIPINERMNGIVPNRQNLQNKYPFMTMIIAKKNDLDDIRRKFQAKNVKCDIEYRFHSYKFKTAHNTAILYHMVRFEELLKIIAKNQEFIYNGRALMAINITGYLKLQSRTSKNKLSMIDLSNLKSWLRLQFPEQDLKLWQFDVSASQKEYYLQTDTKLSTQFMYFVLNHYSEKATFKNPQNFDRMPQEERSKRWRQVGPLGQSCLVEFNAEVYEELQDYLEGNTYKLSNTEGNQRRGKVILHPNRYKIPPIQNYEREGEQLFHFWEGHVEQIQLSGTNLAESRQSNLLIAQKIKKNNQNGDTQKMVEYFPHKKIVALELLKDSNRPLFDKMSKQSNQNHDLQMICPIHKQNFVFCQSQHEQYLEDYLNPDDQESKNEINSRKLVY